MKKGGIASAEMAPAKNAMLRRRQPQDRMMAFARRSRGCALMELPPIRRSYLLLAAAPGKIKAS
jgi:hypothetical protein